MSHANARLTVHGRLLLVERIVKGHRPVSHVAAELGVSRQCAHRWVRRFRDEGVAGLSDRSSRPHRCPRRTSAVIEDAVLELRRASRRGQDWIGAELGLPARTISAILRRHQLPYLRDCDPLTGDVIRSSKATAVRYERARPGELIHMDVKKIGRIPDGGGWKAHGRAKSRSAAQRNARIGFDYVHSVVDDHSRLAYSEILPDEKGATCGEFLARAAEYFRAHGIPTIERLITDNHWSYRRSADVAAVIAGLGAKHVFIKPHCPWQNGKVERYNRTLQTEWAYQQIFTTNDARSAALAPWLEDYNNRRRHSALGGQPPISRLTPTS
ncbi:transposase [Mycolicibacterium aromaticivorans JS19b1 = JCM 16368]|uniref:Transposase n=1 Tax=Mycolicibacterium aromaticivorans JS19b1 = JCM 16368 TaxID=1440774 RepID=A0A064CNG3_9MYCO|nr:IS481 family transposase [Mycolicibacterium aromaticivorans]KDE97636.1 transposase [Mycolicibacterium aromaticivorans JS19b1 = JCM 16368]KDE98780.1 transposase [Mycolicibacterium aromaticivorans JS19b1 = JCM 16368]KDE98900.1 transposase [Mycolicibacterium aromaticivorans JS19b1 = JCM 16368]KDE99734.1 transposase [Mycolicibacterium aromaticivorans JS19b1 = JCM 16368]KDF00318.1 transposase [Mycolicibacterium aromaticivorans JS19b1 = JCM 16368]